MYFWLIRPIDFDSLSALRDQNRANEGLLIKVSLCISLFTFHRFFWISGPRTAQESPLILLIFLFPFQTCRFRAPTYCRKLWWSVWQIVLCEMHFENVERTVSVKWEYNKLDYQQNNWSCLYELFYWLFSSLCLNAFFFFFSLSISVWYLSGISFHRQ